MIDASAQFEHILRQQGYSLTTTRRIVFQALQNQEPQSMRTLIQACGDQIDRASVYRTITLFERLGIVKRLQMGWKYKLELSDQFHDHHHHLTCLKCSKVFPFDEDSQLEQLLERLAKAHNFQMQEHQLEIQGVCAACRNLETYA